MDHLARMPLKVPNSLTGQEHQALRDIAEQVKAHDIKSATNGWSRLLTTLKRKNIPVDTNELLQFVLREAYLPPSRDLKNSADKVKFHQVQITEARREIAKLRDQLARLPSGKPDPNTVKRAVLTKSLREWEARLAKSADDERLAKTNLQNALQNLQGTLQILTNIVRNFTDARSDLPPGM